MNEWYRDPRFRQAEATQIAADQAERDNQRDLAMVRHFEAAEALANLALSVPADYPHTRSDFAISATVSFACAGRYDRAVQFARRMLAQQGALSMRGRGELAVMLNEYEPLVLRAAPAGRFPTRRASQVEHRMRDTVRGVLSRKPEAA